MHHPRHRNDYRGYRFRSRMEARWAVFLDSLRIPWDYEPQGYLVGADKRPYLPRLLGAGHLLLGRGQGRPGSA